MASPNAVGWFEIPTKNIERAKEFYEKVFDVLLELNEMGPLKMAFFPMKEGQGAPGALVQNEHYIPSEKAGVLIYFTAQSGDLDNELARVEPAGGKVLQAKKSIGEYGFVAIILDTEGNRVALHSRN